MKIALVQTNPLIGDYDRNCRMILAAVEKARGHQCDLVIFPELSLCGYPPQDLLERQTFLQAHDRALECVIEASDGIGIIVGSLEQRRGAGIPLYNSALLIEDGKVGFRARKQLLPTYDVFDETRYFEPGPPSLLIPFRGKKLILSVCEDAWFQSRRYNFDPLVSFEPGTATEEADFLVNISASPYYFGKIGERLKVLSTLCKRLHTPLVYVNQVGGQDSLIFDGNSMVLNSAGEIIARAAGFREDMLIVDSEVFDRGKALAQPEESVADVLAGLTLGLRDYLHKTGFAKAVIGLSGGIDSALTAAIACRALGPENVLGVAMPSPYTSAISVEDARQLAANLGCGFETVPIAGAMEVYRSSLATLFAGCGEDVTEQNLQARIRGNILMALSNKFGHILLATGNKSEMAVGYCTLYGDMCGGLAVLADVPKAMVYALARWINSERPVIPERILTRPPTAELKHDQLDQDDLPPYEILDPILTAYLQDGLSEDKIVAMGYEPRIVKDIVRRIHQNEYKRKQAPLGLKVTTKAFGHGRRYPVVQNFRE